jgi:hypothetical protein
LTTAISTVWAAIVGYSFLRVLADAVDVAQTGDLTATGKALLPGLIPVGLAAFLIGIMTWGDRRGRAEAVILRLWVADRPGALA